MRERTKANKGSQHHRSSAELVSAIQRYQKLVARAEGEQELSLTQAAEQRACLEVIAQVAREPLKRETRRWMGSYAFAAVRDGLRREEGIDAAVERFATVLFSHVLEALPTLKLDEQKSVVGLLVVVARRGMNHEEQQIYWPTGTRKGGPSPQRLGDALDAGREFDIVDAQAEEAFALVELTFDLRILREQVVAFLNAPERTPEQRTILYGRLFAQPQASFDDLASKLGPGWTSATVRQRFHRLCERIREVGE